MAGPIGGAFRKPRIRPIRRRRILDILAGLPPGRLLDAPAGDLWLARELAARGFEVHAVDLGPEAPGAAEGIAYRSGDLNRGLPGFADAVFDYVASVEGMEHLENHSLLVREFARVLRPGGLLLLTTPNITSLRSRLKFLLFGYYDGFRRRPLFAALGGEAHPHINPVHLQSLYFALRTSGFAGIRLHSLPVRRAERVPLGPLAGVVAGLGRTRAHLTADPAYRDYATLLTSAPALFSPTLILTATREAV